MRQMSIAVAALLLVAGIAQAQPATMGSPMKMPTVTLGTPASAMPELTADQMSKMSAQRISHLKEAGPIKTDIAVKQMELAGLWRAENVDAKAITAKVTEINALKARLELAKANNMIAMYNILTPEQRKTMRSGMGGMMHGMMQGMMMQGCPMMGSGVMGSGMTGGGMMGMGSMMGGYQMSDDPAEGE
jgi:Spy/CpxP family protein refolding chaperone